MAAKFFTGLPLDGPDPECVKGHGEQALLNLAATPAPRPTGDHSHRTSPRTGDRTSREPVLLTLGTRPPDRACDENPLAGFAPEGPLVTSP
jgi:hypothetical protein